ncbi:hypothetical protein DEO72_LG5g1843 [Vigna unguiculata]|uniref:Uncharacterized protein n=1 Tax=Vigna unguiculata TaxID=3917 RepID=A0A4D6LYJ8_VIGUN|nr:hypothetical protein DEO72_LG5g1843 [Vigna unguiculata]
MHTDTKQNPLSPFPSPPHRYLLSPHRNCEIVEPQGESELQEGRFWNLLRNGLP